MLVGVIFVIAVSDYVVRPDVSELLGGVEALLGLGISRRAYLNRLIPSLSFHYERCMLILYDGTLDLLLHRCMACTKVMEILLLTYPHVLE